MIEKHYIKAQDLLEDSYRLGAKILASEFRPDFVIGIWRGGSPVGIAVHEMLDYFGITTDHIGVRTSLYTGICVSNDKVELHGLGYVARNLNAESALLIVDDVYDTGRSIQAVINELTERAGSNTPSEIRIATPWFKPGNNKTNRKPDYYLHTTNKWLVFPHEILGLSEAELKFGKGKLYDIISGVKTKMSSNEIIDNNETIDNNDSKTIQITSPIL